MQHSTATFCGARSAGRVCVPPAVLTLVLLLALSSVAAVAQNFTATPSSLDFGNVPAGASASLPVTITNVSAVPQTPAFSGGAPLDATNFGGSQNCAGTTLPPGGSCTFTYTFSPTTLGPKSTSTTIGVDSENFPITLSGTGVSAFSVSPTTLAFGTLAVGETATLPVTITNTSGVSQTPSFSGGAPLDATNFGGSQNCAGTTLAPGGSCTFTYTFSPTTLGAKSTSTTIGVDSENFPISLSGTAVSAFSVTPTTLAFGIVAVGATATLPVTITNTSGVSQTPTFSGGAPLDSTNFGGSQNCAGTTLAPGGSCAFTYTFSPATPGAKSTSTTIGVDGENFPITLSGNGGAFTVAPISLSFGTVLVGAAVSLPVTITNVSATAQTPTFSGGAPSDGANFGVVQNCVGATLAPGTSCTFTYTFHPTSSGAKATSATIGIDADPYAIALSGVAQGAPSPATAIPTLPMPSLWLLAVALVVIGLVRLRRRI